MLLLFAVAALGAAGSAVGDHGDVTRPTCADIRFADFGYSTTNVVTAQIETVEPSCRGVTYTVWVIVDPANPSSAVVSASSRGNATTTVTAATEAIVDDDNIVCAYVTSSRGGPEGMNTMFDRTPNEGCVELAVGGSGATGFH